MTTHRLVAPPDFRPTTIELSGGYQLQLPPHGVVEISDVLEFAGDAGIEGTAPPPVKVELGQHVTELMRLGFQHVPPAGPSANRPAAGRYDGDQFFDIDLGRPLWWSCGTWRDAAGTAVNAVVRSAPGGSRQSSAKSSPR
jgi:hypothetical protein